MEAYQERVVAEKKELDEKISKLEAFIQSYRFVDISEDDQDLLPRQLKAMREYASILGERIFGF